MWKAFQVGFCGLFLVAGCAGQPSGSPKIHVLADNGPVPSSAIYDHGGPVIHGTFNIYYIWYGNWSSNTAGAILTDLASNIGGSPYYNINTTYSDAAGPAANAVAFGGSTTDNYSKGPALSDDDIFSIVSSAIESNRLPRDNNGLYYVLTTPEVTESSGFCSAYCGWHDHKQLGATDIKFAFVGDPGQQCASQCEAQVSNSPNGNPPADGMASVIAHELDGTATDPDLNGWFDANEQENADKCVNQYGTTYVAPNGSNANMKLGTRNYLIQENWVNENSGMCALTFP
jgi:Phosphate-induced protein 1 conserved region